MSEPRHTSAAESDLAATSVDGPATARRESAPASERSPSLGMGEQVGRYVVLGELGRGAMGRVLRAYDPKLQREVALKEVHGKSLGKEGALRLVAEARAMAKLSHPNVVGVYDVEEGAERLVIVMEYVAGQDLRAWIKAERRDWQALVGAYLQAGRGLAAAHAAELLHRDFKPDNVLVSHDGLVKVGDFGLAKLTAGSSSSSLVSQDREPMPVDVDLTAAGTVMGTPRYMAPEQHLAEALTPAADQFAFCVALWEALGGESPHAGGESGLAALLRRKLRGPGEWKGPRSIPTRIVDALSRGLAPKPADRWPSMSVLLDALDPSPARPARNLAVVSAVGALLVGGTWWVTHASRTDQACTGAADHLAPSWNDEREAALQQRFVEVGGRFGSAVHESVSRDLGAYASGWIEMHTDACRATTILGEQSSEVMDLRMTCLDRARVALDVTVTVLADAEPGTIRRADRVVGDLPALSRCADVETLRASVVPPSTAEAEAVGQAREHLALSRAHRLAGTVETARAAWEDADRAAAELSYGPLATELALEHGRLLEDLGDYDEAETALRTALQSAHHHAQRAEAGAAATELMVVVGHRLAQGDAGLRYRDIALGLAGDDPARQSTVRLATARIYSDLGRLEQAEAEARTAVELAVAASADPRSLAKSHGLLANILLSRGDPTAAEAELRRTLDVLLVALGPDHPDVATARVNVAGASWSQGKHEAAEEQLRAAIASFEASLGENHPNVATARGNLGNILFEQGRYTEAEALHRRALAILESSLGAEHPLVATTLTNLATTLHLQRRSKEAIEVTRRSLSILEATYGAKHPDVALGLNNVAGMLEDSGDVVAAEPSYRRALELRLELLGDDHPDVAFSRCALAGALVSLDRAPEAIPLAERALTRFERDDTDPSDRAKASFVLARALWNANLDRERARRLATKAVEAFSGMAEARAEELAEASAWLEDHPAP